LALVFALGILMSFKSIKLALKIYWKETFGDTTPTFVFSWAIGAIALTAIAIYLIIKYGHPWDYIFGGMALLGMVCGTILAKKGY